jgi:L-ascorbate metabolism protein UlaG (beta-lactamase superfamily)
MEIKWLGHSCFRIRGKNTTVITDPYSPDLGYRLGKPTTDIVTISNKRPGHSYAAGVGGNPHKVTGPGEYEIGDVIIIGIATFHDGQHKGKNTVYLMELDELSVCHLGNLGSVLTDDQVEELGNVDVLLVPVGGGATVNAATAAEIVRQLEPKAIIPMHYKTPTGDSDLAPVDQFLKEMGLSGVAPQPKLTVTKTNLPPSSQVFLLEYSR